jgi:nucleotide-binding universal stress UspA family protein
MYKRILVPTDGSEITGKAVQTAIGLAKLAGAELFVIGVKEPFPYSAISEMQPVPPQEFYDAQERIAAEQREGRDRCRHRAGVKCTGHTVEGAAPLGGHPRPRQDPGLRPGRDGLARPPRRVGAAAGQRDAEGADAQQAAGAGGPLRARGPRRPEPRQASARPGTGS